MAKKPHYVIVSRTTYESKKLAQEAAKLPGHDLYVVHPYGERCPGGHDHAHAQYDGATFCSGCERYLTLRIEKRL